MKYRYVFMFSMLALAVVPVASAADGKGLYEANCASCHGANAQGAFPGVPDLINSGRLKQADPALIDHIMNGFQTAGAAMGMPPKGGDANLTSDDAKAILVFLRSIPGTSR
ncbi:MULTISPECIES: c-type cytochrome [Rhodanobacter]|uniref:c-type cytochrome n=1 Tax=Rhodanobacter TaxID=75309 RepID=UPI00163952AF|nr:MULTISPECIES: cytochrome c [Rhodanobacter]UJJ55719.1 c-type cytochrome [Rhodanobacter thiooxydans]